MNDDENQYKQELLKRGISCETKLMTLEEVLAKYQMTEKQANELREKMKNGI